MEPIPECVKELLQEESPKPITGLDFSSLYPSIIRCRNLSLETVLCNPKAVELERSRGLKFIDIEFEYADRIIRAWAIDHDNQRSKFGIMPIMLDRLFIARDQVKQQLKGLNRRKEELLAKINAKEATQKDLEEYDQVAFEASCLNIKQLSVKLVANSTYGETGSKQSPIHMIQIAGGVTSYGRTTLRNAAKQAELLGCSVYYGDSVPGDTPVIVRRYLESKYVIAICKIEDLGSSWKDYLQYEFGMDMIMHPKQICVPLGLLEVWSYNGWTQVKRIIRHQTDKPIYEVRTLGGCVRVTSDHSLLDEQFNKITPQSILDSMDYQCTNLAHSFPMEINGLGAPCILTEQDAFYCGVFMANGQCNTIALHWQLKCSLPHANQVKDYLRTHYAEVPLSLTIKGGACIFDVSLEPQNQALFDFFKAHDNIERIRKHGGISNTIINGPFLIKLAFLQGFRTLGPNVKCQNLVQMQMMYYLMRSVGLSVVLDVDNLELYEGEWTPKVNEVTLVSQQKQTQWVYDLETQDGMFQAGVGSIVVHNTDSIYIESPKEPFKGLDAEYFGGRISKVDYCQKAVELTHQIIPPIRDQINEYFYQMTGGRFLSMAYEEVNYFFVLLQKKCYYAKAHEHMADFNGWINVVPPDMPTKELLKKQKEVFNRGVRVKARGISLFAKKIVSLIMVQSLAINNIRTLFELVEDAILRVYQEPNPLLEDFIATDQYKPDKNNVKVKTFVRRMEVQGIEIKPYVRYQYVVVAKYPYKYDGRGRKVPLSAGDKIELYETAVKENLPVDLHYYMEGRVVGMLTQFVACDELFQGQAKGAPDQEAQAQSLARSHIENLCAEHKPKIPSKGKIYQKVFREATKAVNQPLLEKGINKPLATLFSSDWNLDKLDEWLSERAKKEALRMCKGYGQYYVGRFLKDKKRMLELISVYYKKGNNRSDLVKLNVTKKLWSLHKSIRDNVKQLTLFYEHKSSLVEDITELMKQMLGIEHLVYDIPDYDAIKSRLDSEQLRMKAQSEVERMMQDEKLLESIKTFHLMYMDLVSTHLYNEQTESIKKALEDYKVKLCPKMRIARNDPKACQKMVRDMVMDIPPVDFS